MLQLIVPKWPKFEFMEAVYPYHAPLNLFMNAPSHFANVHFAAFHKNESYTLHHLIFMDQQDP